MNTASRCFCFLFLFSEALNPSTGQIDNVWITHKLKPLLSWTTCFKPVYCKRVHSISISHLSKHHKITMAYTKLLFGPGYRQACQEVDRAASWPSNVLRSLVTLDCREMPGGKLSYWSAWIISMWVHTSDMHFPSMNSLTYPRG